MKQSKIKKRFLSLLLLICMALSLATTTVFAADPPSPPKPRSVYDTYFANDSIKDGWYNLHCLDKYIRIDDEGNAELRFEAPTTAYYVESKGGQQYTIKTKGGRYLAMTDDVKNSKRVRTSDSPYLWYLSRPSLGFSFGEFEMCPAENKKYKVCTSAAGYVDGTDLILWANNTSNYFTTEKNLDHYKMRLIPLKADGTEQNNYTIKMSAWAYPALSYQEELPYLDYGDDYTKPINRLQMANALVRLTGSFTSASLSDLAGMIPQEKVPKFTDTESRSAWYLAYWGITNGVGNNKFDPAGLVTREQMAVYLVNAMNYYDKHMMDSALPRSKANLSKYKDANKISSWAKDAMATMVGMGFLTESDGMLNPGGYCTIEQTLISSDRMYTAYEKTRNIGGEMYQKGISKGWHDDGNFIISSYLGGYLTLNSEGKCVVNKTQSQVFTRKFVSKRCFTLQTADGKYLGLSGLPEDGKQLTALRDPYVWAVGGSYGIDRDFFTLWPGGEGTRYVANVSGFSTKDGAPIIVYTTKADMGAPEMKNAAFCIQRVK